MAVTSLFALLCIGAATWLTILHLKQITRLERRFRAIFDGTFQFVGMLTPDGSIIDCNRAALDFSGLKRSEMVGKPFWQGNWWGTKDTARNAVHAAVLEAASGNLVRFEAENLAVNGEVIAVDVSIKPIFDDEKNLQFLIAEGRDITARVHAENASRANELRLQLVLDCIAEGIYQIDTSGNVVFVNKAAQEMFQYDGNSMVGKNAHELIHLRSPEGLIQPLADCPLNNVMKTGETIRVSQDFFNRKDGSFFPIEYVSSPLIIDGITTGAVIAFQDVTKRRETENRVSEFYSMVSHELRTPLTSIRGALRLMEGGKAGALSDRAKQLVGMGREECERLVRLINDILDISKIEAGKLELRLEPLVVEQIIGKTLENLHSLAAEHHVKLTSTIRDNTTFLADRDRVLQILTNLVSNAVKFSPKESEVNVRAASTQTDIVFAVTDQGDGISKRDQEKLFKVFQQIDSTDARPKGGTGLGLAICQALVAQHSGAIGVDSEPGKGSTFWFKLPIRKQQARIVVTTADEHDDVDGERPEILVLEDDDSLSSILYLSLVDQFSIKRAATIKEAELLLKSMKPKAILLDIHLPDGNGLILMEKLRQQPETEDIPFVVMSGSEPRQGVYVEPYIIDFLQKPFLEKHLISALDRALRYKPQRKARALIVEDDAATREMIVDQLTRIGVDCKTAETGEQAVELVLKDKFDMMVLDVGLPDVSGIAVVDVMRDEGFSEMPLLVYTARDLSEVEKSRLTLGITQHLTKSLASEEHFIAVVRGMLSQIVDHSAQIITTIS